MIDPTDIPDTWAQAKLRRQIDRLDMLSEVGLELARDIQGRGAEDAAMAFSRVARAMRMTAMLQSRLIKDLSTAADEADEIAERLAPAYRHKARVEKIVERIAIDACDDETEVDGLIVEAGERLDDEDLYGDVLQRPVGELVALICQDLGLDPDWEALSQEAWAQEEMASGVAGSPFENLTHQTRPPPLAGEGDHEVVERAYRRTTQRPCEHRASPSSAPSG